MLGFAATLAWLGCSSFPDRCASSAKQPSLNIVSILNDYLPPLSDESFTHLAIGVRDFNAAVRFARIERCRLSSFGGGIITNEDLIRAIARFDSVDTLTVVYIASHGSPDGLVLSDTLSFDGLIQALDARTKGTIVLLLDSCYAGVLADDLARDRSARIFAITGTRGPTLERWYSKTVSFSEALARTVRDRYSPGDDGKLTLGQLYDVMAKDIRDWNARYPHESGPITDPDWYGPRDLVVFDFNSR